MKAVTRILRPIVGAVAILCPALLHATEASSERSATFTAGAENATETLGASAGPILLAAAALAIIATAFLIAAARTNRRTELALAAIDRRIADGESRDVE